MDARGAEVLQEVAPWIFNFSEQFFLNFGIPNLGNL